MAKEAQVIAALTEIWETIKESYEKGRRSGPSIGEAWRASDEALKTAGADRAARKQAEIDRRGAAGESSDDR